MIERSPLHQQVDSLPDLVRQIIDQLVRQCAAVLRRSLCERIQRVFLTGCGDSHHAVLNAGLAFMQLAGLPCHALTAMHFARYTAPDLAVATQGTNLVLAVSVSGQVSRTIEALALGRQAGATAVALTGQASSPLAAAADFILPITVPALPDETAGLIIPGVRSYVASQLALYLCAIQIGAQRGHLSPAQARQRRHELAQSADLMEQTISASDAITGRLAHDWQNADHFVFCGSGPNYGVALFNAAKLLEASGDAATAQDLEEWAHLHYFARQVNTPTFLIGAAGRDESRALEIATAARRIGRRLAVIAPAGSALAQTPAKDVLLPLAGPLRECFSPLVTCLPGILFAAARAGLLDEPYFRAFGGGRSAEGGGGISRIRTSERWLRFERE